MSPLETRKQILLTESELNRVSMLEELGVVQSEWGSIKERTEIWRSLANSATHAAARWTGQGALPDHGSSRSSWASTVIHGLRAGLTIWLAFRSRHH